MSNVNSNVLSISPAPRRDHRSERVTIDATTAVCAGFPAALNGLFAAKDVFADRHGGAQANA